MFDRGDSGHESCLERVCTALDELAVLAPLVDGDSICNPSLSRGDRGLGSVGDSFDGKF